MLNHIQFRSNSVIINFNYERILYVKSIFSGKQLRGICASLRRKFEITQRSIQCQMAEKKIKYYLFFNFPKSR